MTGPGTASSILVLNAGSSSIKFAVFSKDLGQQLSGMAEGIGGSARLRVGKADEPADFSTHGEALQAVLAALDGHGFPLSAFRAAAHRVVHGGSTLTQPVRVTPEVIAQINDCTPLAPLHNPHNLASMLTLAELAPDLVQCASFDTAFHATNPSVATRYAIPRIAETKGIRRYGFHGLSYASLVRLLPEVSSADLPGRVLAFHLGNGASLCAIRDGQSVATTMGYSPLDGLTMGTRAGGIDANAVLKLVEDNGLERTKAILNNESGLLGLSGGKSDMRKLMMDASPDSTFAVEHFCYWSLRHAGSLIAAMEGLDAIVFTGGIGENATAVRTRILKGLAWVGVQMDDAANQSGGPRLHAQDSKVACWIVPAQEERMIAADALGLLGQGA